LKSRLKESNLELQVCDNGPGIAKEGPGNGVGLSNTRARLQQLYGDRQSLCLESLDGGGIVVTVSIPYENDGGGVS
jgi:sensor histidine kinase YesM